MKKYLLFFISVFFLVSCNQESTNQETVTQLKKAIIRTREVSTVSKNIDQQNDFEIDFDVNFDNQLIELNLATKPLRTAELTVLNENGSFHALSAKLNFNAFFGNVDILLNGNSVKSCLIAQCQEVKCSDNENHDLSGQFETSQIYLNLTKLAGSSCNSLITGMNKLKIVHIRDENGPEYQGKNIRTQLIKYNLTFTPKGMRNAVD